MKRNEINNIWKKTIEKKELSAEDIAMIKIPLIEHRIAFAALSKDNSYALEITKDYEDTLEIIENYFKNNGFDVEFVKRFTPEDYDYLLIAWN